MLVMVTELRLLLLSNLKIARKMMNFMGYFPFFKRFDYIGIYDSINIGVNF